MSAFEIVDKGVWAIAAAIFFWFAALPVTVSGQVISIMWYGWSSGIPFVLR